MLDLNTRYQQKRKGTSNCSKLLTKLAKYRSYHYFCYTLKRYYHKGRKMPTICPLFALNHQKFIKKICKERFMVTLNKSTLAKTKLLKLE